MLPVSEVIDFIPFGRQKHLHWSSALWGILQAQKHQTA